jgi:phenylalanyl-tRNA synthetase beta chain
MGEAFDLKDHLEVEKPISKEAPYLRQTLLPGILKNISKNSTLFDKISIFEIGTVFSNNKKGAKESPKGGHLPEQKLHVASCLYEKNNKSPYHEILSAYTSLFENLGYSYEIKKPSSGKSFLHPKRQSEIHVHGQRVAFVGELHPAIAKNFGIDERVAVAKTNLSKLVTLTPSKKSYSQISEFPSALRDIAFVVSEDESHGEIKKTLLKSSKLISSAELFDIYRGKNVGEGKKSMAFHLTYQSSNHTLEQSEVEKAHVELTSSLEKKHHAVIR